MLFSNIHCPRNAQRIPFRGMISAKYWGPELDKSAPCFTEFNPSIICHVLIISLGSFQYWLWRDKVWNTLWTFCLLAIYFTGSSCLIRLIRTVCKFAKKCSFWTGLITGKSLRADRHIKYIVCKLPHPAQIASLSVFFSFGLVCLLRSPNLIFQPHWEPVRRLGSISSGFDNTPPFN